MRILIYRQILQVNEMDIIAIIIRTKISELAASQVADLDGDESQETKRPRIIGSEHVSVGSALEATAIEQIEQLAVGDAAFLKFRRNLNALLTYILRKNTIIRRTHKVIGFYYLSTDLVN